ncbi:hypothetical protein ACFQ0X_36235 [Streptomyces rectiviolaceus]|uniref:Uncharacterized protein n=1 Tax=Streptomyces rectiviolaceus TaxID=332591 RepID=A0ABP6N180_9ACTN
MNRRSTLFRAVAVGTALLALAGTAGSATASDAPPPERETAAALTGTAKLDRRPGDNATITFAARLDAAEATRRVVPRRGAGP